MGKDTVKKQKKLLRRVLRICSGIFLFLPVLLLLFVFPQVCLAPPPMPGPPVIPIDGGISILLAAGAAYGSKKIYDSMKKRK